MKNKNTNRLVVASLSKEIDLTTPFNKPTHDGKDVLNPRPANKPKAKTTTFSAFTIGAGVGPGERWPSAKMIRESLAQGK